MSVIMDTFRPTPTAVAASCVLPGGIPARPSEFQKTPHSVLTSLRKGNLLTEDDELNCFLGSIERLLVKYSMYNKSAHPNCPVSSGGLQQFITQKLKKKAETSSLTLTQRLRALYTGGLQPKEPSGSEEGSFFQCMPVDLKLYIFSFLDARSLCQACCVNQDWNNLTCDDLLWQRLLYLDIKKWTQISHLTNPQVYSEVNSDWSTKEIYLKCSPDFQRHLRQSNTTFNQVSTVLKYLMPKKIPKVAMFGPGLEQSTRSIVRNIMYEDNTMFERVAMFPGQFEGIGGGMTLKLKSSGHSMHLSVLYSASRQERENRAAEDRLQFNRLLQRQPQGGEDENEEPVYELQPQIRLFCRTLDALIYVVDATETVEGITAGKAELDAMVAECNTAAQVPLLVMSCAKTAESERKPACDIVDHLELTALSQPWMVMDCV